jgi:hypothetical protein
MRSARVIAALAVPVLILSACTSSKQAVSTPSTTAVSKVAVASSAAAPSPAPTPAVATTKATPKPKPVVKPKPKPVPPQPAPTDPLTGGKPNTNPAIAVKIDNTYFEVPQFGVSDADIVFVEQVEGGLTRLIAVFHTTLPSEVGPVRSVRTTDAQLLPAFGRPALVFSGGAGGPLAALAATAIVDTSAYGNAYFRSDVATGSYNLHADLTKIKSDLKAPQPARSIGFHFAATSPQAAQGKHVSSLHVVMQAGTIDFQYTGGRYVRMRDGSVVSDYQGKVEATDNVLVQHIVDRPDGTVDVIGSPSYLSQTVGSGAVTLYRDGRAVPGTWQRSKATNAFTYLDAKGKPLLFKPGKTWVVLAPQNAQITAN